jgi:hypothetical protein
MQTRKSGLLALVLGVSVFGAACEDKEAPVAPVTPPVITLTIAPKPVPNLAPGATFQLVAVVSGTTNQAASFTSSNTACATVNATSGLVSIPANAANGCTSVITAVSGADATARDAVTVTVQGTAPPQPPGTPTVSIQTINVNGTNVPVNPGAVAGRIDVIANVEIPAGVVASAIRVTVNGVEVCRQTFSNVVDPAVLAEQVPVIINCTINTAALTAAGVPQFPNGNYNIKVEVLGPTGTVLAAATSQPLTFANVNFVGVAATASGATATDNAGLVWSTGDLTVTASPGIFTGTTPVSQVTITVFDNGIDNAGGVIAQTTVATAAANGSFSFTFTKAANAANGLLDVSEAEGPLVVQVTSVIGGQPGPTGFFAVPTLRLDNDAPDAEVGDPAVTFNLTNLRTAGCTAAPPEGLPQNCNFFGTNTTITGTNLLANLAASTDDEGVNRNTVTFQFNTNTAATNSSSGWTTFTTAAQLPQTTTTSFVIRAQVCDALGNCATPVIATCEAAPCLFGADVSPPTIADITAAPDSIDEVQGDAAPEMTVQGVENLSGFPSQFVQVRMVRTQTSTGGTVTTRCVDPTTGAVIIDPATGTNATATSPACFVAITGSDIQIPAAAGNGYFEVTARVVDNAGNVSTTLTKLFLVDNAAPVVTVSSVSVTASTASTLGSATVSGTITDTNGDIANYDTRLYYAGSADARLANGLPFTTLSTASGTFGLPMTTSVAATGTAPLVRGISNNTSAAGTALSAGGFGGFDVANNFGQGSFPFGATAAGTFGTAADYTLAGFSFTTAAASLNDLCRTGTAGVCTGATAGASPPPTTNTSRAFTATLQTDPNTLNPAVAVYFYALIPTSNGLTVPVLFAVDNTADLTILSNSVPVNVRNWTYNGTLSVSQLPPVLQPGTTYAINVFAVAVDLQGDAVASANVGPITVY